MWWSPTSDPMWCISLPAFLLRGEMQGVVGENVLKMFETAAPGLAAAAHWNPDLFYLVY